MPVSGYDIKGFEKQFRDNLKKVMWESLFWKRTKPKTFDTPCRNCGWNPAPGSCVKCDSVRDGPFYCPECNKELELVELEAKDSL